MERFELLNELGRLPSEYAQYSDYDSLRQVSGRNHVGFVDMVKLDIYYIIVERLKIMFRTVGVMIFSRLWCKVCLATSF
ncbi:hypothetical protein LCA211_1547 [Lacticaseibacillus casei 21/1]|nr:hypothetical protein LCA211_1547 [Lacticaseibacillus casei 21/1]